MTGGSGTRPSALIILPQQKTRRDLQLALEAVGFQVACAGDAQDALGFLASREHRIDIAVIDGDVLGPDVDLLRLLRDRFPAIEFLLLQSGSGDGPAPAGHIIVEPPFDVSTIVESVQRRLPAEVVPPAS